MKVLDLFCCAGGAGMGYFRAGFEVTGVDLFDQPRYPFRFFRGDALEFVAEHGHEFDLIHASPPCQAFSKTRNLHSNEHPDLLEPTRAALIATGRPYIIENVVGAPLLNPLTLCGTEFGLTARDTDGTLLKLVRHRLFETNLPLMGAGGCFHNPRILTATIYGAGGGWTPEHRDSEDRAGGYVPHTDVCRALLGVNWTTKHELSQVVPPAYTEFLGEQAMALLSAPLARSAAR